MAYSNFRLNVAARVALLTALAAAFAWSLVATSWQVTPIVVAVGIAALLWELIRYVESVSRELTAFLEFVSHHDFSVGMPVAEKGKVFRHLESAYRSLADAYRRLNLEKAANHQYLESLIEHVSVALVCFDDDGTVTLMNRQAQALFKTPHLQSAWAFGRIDPKLPPLIEELGNGGRALADVRIDGEPLQLALFATEFQLLERRYKLVSFQNIRDELEQREVDFSQKLIKVLTHEIMNSVTPIISLSKVIGDKLLELGASGSPSRELAPEERDDLVRSVASIQSRSGGLLRFVQAYSKLTNLPRPKMAGVDVPALLEQTATLMAPALNAERVELVTRVSEPGLSVNADPEQLQQVLINLVRNAVEALADRQDGRIELAASRDAAGKVQIQVIDNGPGIDPEQLDSIFVPFFTTKRHGTGVGLSVSRQIMFLNKGVILVKTAPGRGCQFTLRFR